MSDYKFTLDRDSKNRLEAEICPSITASIKLLDEAHPRRVESHTHAYVIFKVATELGPFMSRDIRIMQNPETKEFFLRYRQFKTGRTNGQRPEWLDIFGPWDQTTREKVQEQLLALFEEIKTRAANGDLPASIRRQARKPSAHRPQRREVHGGNLGDNPVVAAQLERVKTALETPTGNEEKVEEASAE